MTHPPTQRRDDRRTASAAALYFGTVMHARHEADGRIASATR